MGLEIRDPPRVLDVPHDVVGPHVHERHEERARHHRGSMGAAAARDEHAHARGVGEGFRQRHD